MSAVAAVKDILSPGWRTDVMGRWNIVPDEEYWPSAWIVGGKRYTRA